MSYIQFYSAFSTKRDRKQQRCIQNRAKRLRERAFYKNSKWLLAVRYFYKKVHLRYV